MSRARSGHAGDAQSAQRMRVVDVQSMHRMPAGDAKSALCTPVHLVK
jgi:hypothetical protein